MPIPLQELDSQLAKMPPIADDLRKIMQSSRFHGVIDAGQAGVLRTSMDLTLEQLAVRLLDVSRLYAVAPISRFSVGAVGVGLTGALYFGANLEVPGQTLGSTVHAEQAAVANAWVNGERGLSTLAVSAAPCGHCRQFLHEMVDASALTVAVPGRSRPLASYLPDAFGPGDLGRAGGLMQAQHNGLAVARPLDAVGVAALAAANASYSPYTSAFAGVALRTGGGLIVVGRYAENAAYNPSLSPLQAALSQLVLHDQPFSSIAQAVLVEAPGPISQADSATAVLGSVCSVPLSVYSATVR